MAEKVDIFMPIYIGDYLADTTELAAEEHGAYLLLMFAAWRRGGRLPNDQEQLRRAARVSERRWQKVWGMIARFFTVDGDALIQVRLNQELAKAQAKRASASASGKASAEARRRQREDEHSVNDRSTNVGTNEPTEPQQKVNSSPSTTGSLSLSRSGLPDLGADQTRTRSEPRAIAPVRGTAYRPAPVGSLTPAFLGCFERFPNSYGKNPAAAVWQDLAAAHPGGEPGLERDVLASFARGVLKRHPYNAELRYRPSFEKFLRDRLWEDAAPGREAPAESSGFVPRPFPTAAKAGA